MMTLKKTDFRTKRKAQQEAKSEEDRREIDDFLAHEYATRAKAREIIEEYFNGDENTGERQRK
jgi:hypothetical protein